MTDRFLCFLFVLCADNPDRKLSQQQQGSTAAAHAACADKVLQACAGEGPISLLLLHAETGA